MPMRSTFEISTQIILLKIDGFLKGWILNITPLKCFPVLFTLFDLSENRLVLIYCLEHLRMYIPKHHTAHTVILPDRTLKNGASLILPSSIARNSSATNAKRIFEIL